MFSFPSSFKFEFSITLMFFTSIDFLKKAAIRGMLFSFRKRILDEIVSYEE